MCGHLVPVTDKIKADYQKQMLQQFGAIEESAFPPCIQALVCALTAGTNLTHAGRFSLTTFLHAIGMNVAGIAELYGRSPDFDIEKTMYQVEHITGRGGSGTEYTTPACAAMQTTGLCVHSDKICETVGHPLSYYKKKKREVEKKAGETRRRSRNHLRNLFIHHVSLPGQEQDEYEDRDDIAHAGTSMIGRTASSTIRIKKADNPMMTSRRRASIDRILRCRRI